MAGFKRSNRTGAVAPVAANAGQGAHGAGKHDAVGPDRSGPVAAKAQPRRAGWAEVQAKLKTLEGRENPVCHIYWPDEVGEVWLGAYGGAKIHKGEPQAITSDGKRHAL